MPESLPSRLLLLAAFVTTLALAWDTFGNLPAWWELEMPPSPILEWIPLSVAAGAIATILLRSMGRGCVNADRVRPFISDTMGTIGHLPRLRRIPPRSLPLVTATTSANLLAIDCSVFLLFVIIIMMIAHTPRMPYGLKVNFHRPNAATVTAVSSATLGVYVDREGHFNVNGKRVAREMLRITLKQELNRRATTTIYFEADDDSAYGQCVYAVDTIKGLGADLI